MRATRLWARQRWRFVLPFVLGAVMVGVAGATGDRALLFPEGVALAFGCWAMRRPDWCGLRWRLVLAPLLCAAAGLAAVALLPARLPGELLALTAAILITAALRAPIAPALSAAVLPTVARVHSLTYALSVAVIAAVVLSGVLLRTARLRNGTRNGTRNGRRNGRRTNRAPHSGNFVIRAGDAVPDGHTAAAPPTAASPATSRPATSRLALTWSVSAGWLAVAAALGLPLAASAPPLVASGYEWIAGGKPRRARDGARLGAALTAAWSCGAIAAWRVASPAGAAGTAGAVNTAGATMLAGLIALAAAGAVMAVARVPHAPVPAIALVPLVLGPPHTGTGVLGGACAVALAVAVLYASGSALLRATAARPARPPLAADRTSLGATGLRHAAAVAKNPTE